MHSSLLSVGGDRHVARFDVDHAAEQGRPCLMWMELEDLQCETWRGGGDCRAIPAWETCTQPSPCSLAASGSNMAASEAAASRSPRTPPQANLLALYCELSHSARLHAVCMLLHSTHSQLPVLVHGACCKSLCESDSTKCSCHGNMHGWMPTTCSPLCCRA